MRPSAMLAERVTGKYYCVCTVATIIQISTQTTGTSRLCEQLEAYMRQARVQRNGTICLCEQLQGFAGRRACWSQHHHQQQRAYCRRCVACPRGREGAEGWPAYSRSASVMGMSTLCMSTLGMSSVHTRCVCYSIDDHVQKMGYPHSRPCTRQNRVRVYYMQECPFFFAGEQ